MKSLTALLALLIVGVSVNAQAEEDSAALNLHKSANVLSVKKPVAEYPSSMTLLYSRSNGGMPNEYSISTWGMAYEFKVLPQTYLLLSGYTSVSKYSKEVKKFTNAYSTSVGIKFIF